MEADRLSNDTFSRATLAVLHLRVPDYDAKLAAALERERRDQVPRSDTEKIIRRQMPVSVPVPEAESDIYAAIAAAIELPVRPRPERWFWTRRGRMRVEAYVAGGSLAILLGPASALFYVSEVAGAALFVAAALTMLLALGVIYVEALQGCEDDDSEDANERAVARLVSGRGIDTSE